MTFTKNSRIAQSYTILVHAGEMTTENIPNVGNLHDAVQEILTA